MKKHVKILLGIVLAVLSIIVTLAVVEGYFISRIGLGFVENEMKAEPQENLITPSALLVKKSFKYIKRDPVYVLDDFEICEVEGQPKYQFSYGISCKGAQNCSTSIVPRGKALVGDLVLNRKYQGVCRPQTISNIEKYEVQRFLFQISIDAATAQHLQISDIENASVEKTPNSRLEIQSTARMDKNVNVVIQYTGQPPAMDEFTYGRKLVKIQYIP